MRFLIYICVDKTNIMKNKKVGNILIITGTSLLFIFLFLIYFNSVTDESYSVIQNLKNKNEIGDALGGIIAPFIGLVGVVLTFLAFYVQYEFNKKQLSIYHSDKISQKNDEFLRLLESVISINSIDDVDVKRDIKTILNQLVGELEVNKDVEFQLNHRFNNIEELFTQGLNARIPNFINDKGFHSPIHSTKIEDYKKLSNLIEQYFNLLKIYKIELKILSIEDSEIVKFFILFDNKFDVLCGKQIEQFKGLMLFYFNFDEEYDEDINYFLQLKYGDFLDVYQSIFDTYTLNRNPN